MGTPLVGGTLHMLSESGSGRKEGLGCGLGAKVKGRGGRGPGCPVGSRIQRQLRILNSNLLFQVIVKIYLSE